MLFLIHVTRCLLIGLQTLLLLGGPDLNNICLVLAISGLVFGILGFYGWVLNLIDKPDPKPETVLVEHTTKSLPVKIHPSGIVIHAKGVNVTVGPLR